MYVIFMGYENTPVLTMSENFNHQMKCIAGKYKCTDCSYTTMNVVSAKGHFADKNGIDYDLADLF